MDTIKFSSVLSRFNESATIKMAQLARNLKAQGKDVIDLSLGEPDFNTPDYIKKAGIEAIENNYSHYAPVAGYPELRKAVVKKLERDNALFYQPENVLISTGAKQAIYNLLVAIVDAGDEVLIPTPYWGSYADIVNMVGGKPIAIKTKFENHFKLQPEDLKAAITPRTKLFMYSAPSNPCGANYTSAELTAFADIFRKHPQVAIMSDEIYEYLLYEGSHSSIASHVDLQNRTIIIGGMSKAYAMTGWRIGYMVAPVSIVQQCAKLQAQVTSGANSVAQMTSVAALHGGKAAAIKMRDEFAERRKYIVDFFSKIKGVRIFAPSGAFYIFPDMSAFVGRTTPSGKKITSTFDLSMYLLEECYVSSVSGDAFGEDTGIRFSFANSLSNIKKACERIEKGLVALK